MLHINKSIVTVKTLANKFYIFVVSCLKVICWVHYRCIRFDIIICIIMTYSVYIIKNYHTGRRNVLAFDFDDLFVDFDEFQLPFRRISTSTSTNFDSTSTNFNSTSTNFNSTSTNFNSTSTNLYSTLTIFSQLRRIWIETDIWTYENDIFVMEMICTCS